MDDGRIGRRKVTTKGKVNELEMLDGLNKLGKMVLNVLHE